MKWFGENKFLGFLSIITVVGTALLALQIYTSWGRYSESADKYQQQSENLKMLLQSVPSTESRKKYKQEQEKLSEKVAALKKLFGGMRVVSTVSNPEDFQDSLASSVGAVLSAAKANSVSVPDQNFYLGFGQYKTSPPKPDRVGALVSDLEARKWIANLLISCRIDEFTQIKSEDVKQEIAQPKLSGTGTAKNVPSYSKCSFDFEFVCSPTSFRNILNGIAGAQGQLLIVRSVRIQNTQEKGPPRNQEVNPTPVQNEEHGAGAAPTASFKFIVGEEKIKVLLKIDVLEFPKEA